MKFKKMLTVLFTSVLLLTFSSSTSAMPGVADTQETALTYFPGQFYSLYLSSDSSDKDWFKWTNNTGKNQFAEAWAAFEGGDPNKFRLGYRIDYGNGRQSDLVYLSKDGNGNSIALQYLYVPQGATLYVVVDHEKNAIAESQYRFFCFFEDV
ncbi:hypothetical protein [Paenibacillus woosongensis]|uniref:Secreted protein n=1 Tax=Paenibacillus woosongensis TaxID=307580 RepID=A0ABQ4MTF8_9BACL|nr:hypothetical protein [Paenibacillus woosongensis]GIP59212.1 hypothetical protein J15TS10_30260 [Paenibacillus woosongensis]